MHAYPAPASAHSITNLSQLARPFGMHECSVCAKQQLSGTQSESAAQVVGAGGGAEGTTDADGAGVVSLCRDEHAATSPRPHAMINVVRRSGDTHPEDSPSLRLSVS